MRICSAFLNDETKVLKYLATLKPIGEYLGVNLDMLFHFGSEGDLDKVLKDINNREEKSAALIYVLEVVRDVPPGPAHHRQTDLVSRPST